MVGILKPQGYFIYFIEFVIFYLFTVVLNTDLHVYPC